VIHDGSSAVIRLQRDWSLIPEVLIAAGHPPEVGRTQRYFQLFNELFLCLGLVVTCTEL
jgi:hypothetical protein